MIDSLYNQTEIAVRYYEKKGRVKPRRQAEAMFRKLKRIDPDIISEILEESSEEVKNYIKVHNSL